MSKQLAVILVSGVVLGACAQQQATTPLAKLATPSIEIVANKQVNVLLHVDETSGCPLLGEDVQALFDGQPMQMTRGGYDTNSNGCFPIGFWFNSAPMDAINGYEKTTNGSQLVIQDKSSQWGVDTTRLFANDFAVDATTSQIVWTDVSQITSAQIYPGAVVQVAGNTIRYTPGTTPQWVDALAHPVPTRCDGPTQCLVNLEGTRNWDGQNP